MSASQRIAAAHAAIEAEGYAVEFVEWCEDAETPGLLGMAAGVTVHRRRAVKVRTHAMTPQQIAAVLEHELEHVRGAARGADHHDLGLACGGTTNVYGEER